MVIQEDEDRALIAECRECGERAELEPEYRLCVRCHDLRIDELVDQGRYRTLGPDLERREPEQLRLF